MFKEKDSNADDTSWLSFLGYFSEEVETHIIEATPVKLDFCNLPSEIILRIVYETIISETPPRTAVVCLPLTSRTLYRLSQDPIIWEKVFSLDYDKIARKRRFLTSNFRKAFYRRSKLTLSRTEVALSKIEPLYQDTLDGILEVLTSVWLLIAENDGRNTQRLLELRIEEFCSQVYQRLYFSIDLSLKHFASVLLAVKILSYMLAQGQDVFHSIAPSIAIEFKNRLLEWDPSKDAAHNSVFIHALHVCLRYENFDLGVPLLLPSSVAFETRKIDKWMLWFEDTIDVYSSNKVLWCMRNDAYDMPMKNYWTGICTNYHITKITQLLILDLNYVNIDHREGEPQNQSQHQKYASLANCEDEDVGYFIIEGRLTNDSGQEFDILGESVPIDKGRRVSFEYLLNDRSGDKWQFCGFYVATFGIVGRCWKEGMCSVHADFFWIWEDVPEKILASET